MVSHPSLSGNKSFHFSLGTISFLSWPMGFKCHLVHGIQVSLGPHVAPGMMHMIRPGQTENQESM